jgi:hypothetical protein
MHKVFQLSIALLVAASAGAALSQPASAEGALAIGLPRDTAKDGIALGYALRHPTRASAEHAALDKCRAFKEVPPATRALCRVVASFRGQCLAIALDRQPGVKGEGWAMEYDQQAAERMALDRCRATATRDLGRYCEITVALCDR